MAIAVATPVVFVMRVYINEDNREAIGKKHNIPYDYCFTVIITEDTATLEGIVTGSGVFSPSHRLAVFDELRRFGVKQVRWIRIKDGEEKEVKFRI